MSVAVSVGSRLPAFHTSMGRVQLGFPDEAELWRLRTGHCLGGTNVWMHPSVRPLDGRCFVGGLGGEIGRGFLWLNAQPDITGVLTVSTQRGLHLLRLLCPLPRSTRKWQSIDDHYRFSDGHLANVKGYEAYGKTAKTYAKLKDPANLKKATDFYVSIQIVGTPDDCLQQIGQLQGITGMDHLVTEFAFGNLPHHEAEKAMRLFADKVLPTLQRDPAFAAPRGVTGEAAPRGAAQDNIFAPA